MTSEYKEAKRAFKKSANEIEALQRDFINVYDFCKLTLPDFWSEEKVEHGFVEENYLEDGVRCKVAVLILQRLLRAITPSTCSSQETKLLTDKKTRMSEHGTTLVAKNTLSRSQPSKPKRPKKNLLMAPLRQ